MRQTAILLPAENSNKNKFGIKWLQHLFVHSPLIAAAHSHGKEALANNKQNSKK